MWEYKTFLDYNDGVNEIAKAGREGWEAFQVIPTGRGTYTYYCKRPCDQHSVALRKAKGMR